MHTVLGKDIDREKTANKARYFLEHDLPKLASMADRDITSLSSPQLSFICSHSNGMNHQQDMLIDHWSADTALVAVHAAAHHIPNFEYERDIFILTYFKHYSEDSLAIKYSMSNSTLRRRKKKALVEFARRLDVQKVKPQHNCDWLESLVVDNLTHK